MILTTVLVENRYGGMSQRYCCGVSERALDSLRGHWHAPVPSVYTKRNEAILFPVQALEAASPPPTEQEQHVGEGGQLKLLSDHSGQTVNPFSQVCITADDVDLAGPDKAVQHMQRISTSVFSYSAPHCG